MNPSASRKMKFYISCLKKPGDDVLVWIISNIKIGRVTPKIWLANV